MKKIGVVLACGLVFGVAWGKRMSPVTLILAGLVLGLYCGAVNSLLALFHYDQLQGMFLWGTGALNQQDWSAVQFLLPRLLVAGLLAALLLRPLTLLGLDDGADPAGRGQGERPGHHRDAGQGQHAAARHLRGRDRRGQRDEQHRKHECERLERRPARPDGGPR